MELQPFPVQKKSFLLGIELEGALLLSSLQLLEPSNLLPDGLEVREHAPKPTLGHIECTAFLRLLLNDRAELAFGTDEKDPLARKNDLPDGFLRQHQPVEGLA